MSQETRLPAAADVQKNVASEVMSDALSANANNIVRAAVGHSLSAVSDAMTALDQINAVGPGDCDLSPPVERRLYSIARCCSLLGVMPDQLRRVMRASGVRFAERRDSCGYVDGPGLLALQDKINELRK